MQQLIMVIILFFSFNLFSMEKVIYGDDNRVDIPDLFNNLYLDLAKSTAAMIASNRIVNEDGNYKVKWGTLADMGICSDERFASQPAVANCSGFLVADDLLVTAGHCIQNMNDCQGNYWVFDYNTSNVQNGAITLKAESLYRCTEIVKRSLDRYTKDDFAVVRLDRPVTGRYPLHVRREGKILDKTPLVIIGHPTGLPTKVADGAYVRSNSEATFFVANLDSFGGNSGSAVFDATTGIVEGILVRGETDYIYDYERGCRIPKKCDLESCRGEDVTRITNLIDVIPN